MSESEAVGMAAAAGWGQGEDNPVVVPGDSPSETQVNPQPSPEGETGEGWVTVKAASEVTGASVSVIRKWFKRGDIPSDLRPGPNGPQRFVPLDAVRERVEQWDDKGEITGLSSEAVRTPSKPRNQPGQAVVPLSELSGLFDRLATAEARAIRAELELQHLREQLASARGYDPLGPPEPAPGGTFTYTPAPAKTEPERSRFDQLRRALFGR